MNVILAMPREVALVYGLRYYSEVAPPVIQCVAVYVID
jgi:hypothetical protein